MWHLIATELAGHTAYRNMKIWSMRTIKASVKNVYVNGQKVQSALFNMSTKPIFRSESARYVLFIQMSKEMWDFDASGSGEIMFSKALNGFLPELFQRWQCIDVKHLVTVVLFTRIEYHDNQTDCVDHDIREHLRTQPQGAIHSHHKDFYRVVVSDMASGEGERILRQLKAEFKVFLRDVCVCRPTAGKHFSFGSGFATASATELPEWVIRGHPCSANHGNILEAISLASSQFSSDYVDRDLVRTGVSIAVITPGTGVFEVEYNQLLTTTENLVANGIGIDLICLSRMPLHSVPLFKYTASQIHDGKSALPARRDDQSNQATPNPNADLSIRKTSENLRSSHCIHRHGQAGSSTSIDHWSYAIPHWIDVSFWTSALDETKSEAILFKEHQASNKWQARKAFRPRVRMYELQMLGAMETTMDHIAIPYLPSSFALPKPNYTGTPDQTLRPLGNDNSEEVSRSSSSRRNNRVTPTWTPTYASKSKSPTGNSVSQLMDRHDEIVFLQPDVGYVATCRSDNQIARDVDFTSLGSTQNFKYAETMVNSGSFESSQQDAFDKRPDVETLTDTTRRTSLKKANASSGAQSSNSPLAKPARFSRQLSFGLRGFGITTPKAIASTELFAEHAKSPSLLGRTSKTQEVSTQDTASMAEVGRFRDQSITGSRLAQPSNTETTTLSRPIPIRKDTAIRHSYGAIGESQHAPPAHLGHEVRRHPAEKTPWSEDEETTLTPNAERNEAMLKAKVLSSCTALTSWMTVLNPCNPPKTDTPTSSRMGRWQHVFPRPLRASKIKWKSLCSPAAVPITTDDFPSATELKAEFKQYSYHIGPVEKHDLSETPCSRNELLREMTAIRLSHGFQFVTSQGVARCSQRPADQELRVFDKDLFTDKDLVVHLSKNNLIHQLEYVENRGIEVKCFVRPGIAPLASAIGHSLPVIYRPAIRTMLADEYKSLEIKFHQQPSDLDWHKLDLFLSGVGQQPAATLAGALRFWRARYVLIPVDRPANSRRPLQSMNEDSEEEMRLEGIQRLTQMWQRFRYVTPEERRFQATLRRRKDTNPLDIMYQTRNPSAIVAAEKENIGEAESAGSAVELLPDSELYQRSDLNLVSLAQTIQSDKGVRMIDRRWHWRLHYSCFIGFEMTTWILQNFRDIGTREEAVELGNELMDNGLFQHVEQRHNFRDGNFFYQIASEYRIPRAESRSWFGTRKSVPATPVSEAPGKDFPKTPGSRSSSNVGENIEADNPNQSSDKQRLGVALSKSLLYDVDHRKRSYRRELITLHYDRLHNPDNCYHIRIEWMNVTSKLIEDAIVSWATTVERYGLKLVEVPLAEASAVTDMHPFRAPYLIRLALPPPTERPQVLSYLDEKSFNLHIDDDPHSYQKAILKKFHYVLDFEAARDFPPDVDVAYSWGKPDYTYAQYVHKSGVLLVQITDDGHFLVLANRLYNDRNAIPREAMQQVPDSKFQSYRNSVPLASPQASPYSSPIVRPSNSAHIAGRQEQISSYNGPEQLKIELESFCQDTGALELFYDETLHGNTTPGQQTPHMESSIPTLGLPPSLMRKDKHTNMKPDV